MIKLIQAKVKDVLSQHAKGKISFGRMVELLNEDINEQSKESNNLIRSFASVVERRGLETNWAALEVTLKKYLKENNPY